MKLILARFPKETLLKEIDHLEFFMQSVLGDANEEARRQA